MENKDQLNQITGEGQNTPQDEKTSKNETVKDEAVTEGKSIENKDQQESVQENPVTTEGQKAPETDQETAEKTGTATEAVTEEGSDETDAVKPGQVEDTVASEAKEQTEAEIPVEEKEPEMNDTDDKATPETGEQVKEVAKEEPAGEHVVKKAEEEEKPDEVPEKVADESGEEKPETEQKEIPVTQAVKDETGQAEIDEKNDSDTVSTEKEMAMVIEDEAEQKLPGKLPESPDEKEQKPSAEPSESTTEKEQEPSAESTESPDETADIHDDIHGEDEEEHEEEIAETQEVAVDYEQLKREELLEALDSLVHADDINKIKAKIAAIKVAFLKKSKDEKEERYQHYLEEGGDKENYHPAEDPLEEKFNELFDIYRQKRLIFLENLEKEKVENLAKKQAILDELKELINSEETLKKTYDEFRTLQERWKEIGMVPKSEVNNLWQNYHFLVEKFFDKVKINRELRDLDLKKNLQQKIVLCEKAEELLLENSILKSFKALQRLHEQWKEIGPVPADKRDEIWDRFKAATEKINLRRREHYKKLQEEQQNNLIAKTALCEKAENLLTETATTIKEWTTLTKSFNDLFKVWKTIGPAPKKQNDEIWERFKTSLDTFFTEKKEYFAKIKDQQINNYNLKLDLCVQAEAMKDSTDWRTTTRNLINLQKEWKEIGPVPRKHSDKIWKRFRAACDEFFNRKADHFANIKNEEAENLKKKEELIKKVEAHEFDGSKSENLSVLKDFQRQWTEIGFVPIKEKERLQNAFRDAINKQLDKLNISDVEMSLANYKSKFEVIKDSPDAQRQLYRERTFIQNKISKLQEDILLWENNLGFLADSKKASLLKAEFEKKIEKAKKDVDVLKAKLKFLNN